MLKISVEDWLIPAYIINYFYFPALPGFTKVHKVLYFYDALVTNDSHLLNAATESREIYTTEVVTRIRATGG